MFTTREKMLKSWTGAARVVAFDYGYRKRDPETDTREGKNEYARGHLATVV